MRASNQLGDPTLMTIHGMVSRQVCWTTTVLAQGRRISPTRTTNSRAHSSGPVAGVALTVTPPRAIVSALELSTRRSLEPSRPLVGAFTNSPG